MALGCDETHKMLKASGVCGEKPSTAGLSWGSPGPPCWSARTGRTARIWLRVEGHGARIIR